MGWPELVMQWPGDDDWRGDPCPDGLNEPPYANPSNRIEDVGAGTVEVTLFEDFNYSRYRTKAGCIRLPLKSGGTLAASWNQFPGINTILFPVCYDHWQPAGRASVFSFLPFLSDWCRPMDTFYSRQSNHGLVRYDWVGGGAGNPTYYTSAQNLAKRTWYDSVTYFFTEQDLRSGTCYRYGGRYHGTPGRLLRRWDRNGNTIYYHYSDRDPNPYMYYPILRKMTGDLSGITPYFEYADERGRAPITKIHMMDGAGPDHRTLYFQYEGTLHESNTFLEKIVNANGCVREYKLFKQSGLGGGHTAIKKERDAEGYTTYFEYGYGGELAKTVQPEGRVVYYDWNAFNETRMRPEGREETYFFYSGSGGTVFLYRKHDAYGNKTLHWWWGGDTDRVYKKLDPNGNLTYWSYNSEGSIAKVVRGPDRATTDYIYEGNGHDVHKKLGPRHAAGSFPVVTYYEYDGNRTRTAIVDPLASKSHTARDANGRVRKAVDRLGHATYHNYNGTTGHIDSRVDALGNVTYFGYNSWRETKRRVSPRWTEAGAYAQFTTYYEYDSAGRRVKTIDPLGNESSFDYTSRHQLSMSLDPRNKAAYFEYNGLKLMTKRSVVGADGTRAEEESGYDTYKNRTLGIDARDNPTYFFYDQLDRLVARRDAMGHYTYFGYDVAGNRRKVRDGRANTSYFYFDELSRLKAQRDALDNYTYYTYDLAGNRTKVQDARLNSAYFYYDALDRTKAGKDSLGEWTYFFYDGEGNRTAIRDARLNSAYFFYDAMGRRKAARDAAGEYAYFHYDAAGNLTVTRDAALSATYFFYDGADRQTARRDALGDYTYFSYDAAGNRTAVRDANLNSAYFFYDGLNRIKASRDALVGHVYYGYDAAGNMLRAQDPRLNSAYFEYDALNRRTKAIDAMGSVTYFAYDAVGNLDRSVGPRWEEAGGQAAATTYFRYDALNRIDAVKSPDGGCIYFGYDEVGNRAVEADPLGNATYYEYDAVSRLQRMIDPLARAVYYEYDGNGNLAGRVDQEGASATFEYTVRNERRKAAYSDGVNSYYDYDAVGNVSGMADAWGTHNYACDVLRRPTRHEFPASMGTAYFAYDAIGNLTTLGYPGAAVGAYFSYDALNRLVKVVPSQGTGTYHEYDAASNRTRTVLGNGVEGHMSYDNASRVSAIRWHDGATPLCYFEFDRGAGGIIDRLHQPVAGGTAYYSYDVNDRLTKESWDMEVGQWGNGPWGQFAWGGGTPYFEYAYDLAGNRTRKRRYEGPWTYYEYAADNSLTKSFLSDESAATYYEYDKTGACEKIVAPEGTAYFAYNAAGLVKEFSRAGKTFEFAYDGNMQRHAVVEDGTATYYLWDGLRLLETRNADGTLKARFTHGHTSINGIGSCVEIHRASDSKRYYLLYDHRGTAHVLLDESKTEIARRLYNAFGELIKESGTWPTEVPFGYQSNWTFLCELPDGSPLYLSTRVYHAGVGRFLQRDWLRYPNRYICFTNCPPKQVDPHGLVDADAGGEGGWWWHWSRVRPPTAAERGAIEEAIDAGVASGAFTRTQGLILWNMLARGDIRVGEPRSGTMDPMGQTIGEGITGGTFGGDYIIVNSTFALGRTIYETGNIGGALKHEFWHLIFGWWQTSDFKWPDGWYLVHGIEDEARNRIIEYLENVALMEDYAREVVQLTQEAIEAGWDRPVQSDADVEDCR